MGEIRTWLHALYKINFFMAFYLLTIEQYEGL